MTSVNFRSYQAAHRDLTTLVIVHRDPPVGGGFDEIGCESVLLLRAISRWIFDSLLTVAGNEFWFFHDEEEARVLVYGNPEAAMI